eukprot:6214821-Pleurochrysis_carterae.AAC.2
MPAVAKSKRAHTQAPVAAQMTTWSMICVYAFEEQRQHLHTLLSLTYVHYDECPIPAPSPFPRLLRWGGGGANWCHSPVSFDRVTSVASELLHVFDGALRVTFSAWVCCHARPRSRHALLQWCVRSIVVRALPSESPRSTRLAGAQLQCSDSGFYFPGRLRSSLSAQLKL